ncbi:DHS-like NAD/FAD-binding domain-containing protein [Laetiporus sulphureus 93-53]|uniref:DHS-like NAD/FAD-binding domain-containing protein n=1 Tax=Laetiporus sulphureus 93-53 TaxID=1314785 RepID=A0A165CAV1_9APHY|nr:DHS-like NAD/FAD-binding domain-containing protein [Laetiporus sulphureus 93-53]KZT02479.1 DHS-like NAD/FAD-binding domain-containing protein [Laetiporus sulphureus 93-53]
MTITLNLDENASNASVRRTLSTLSLSVAKCKRIVVVTGAGISCSCGIPDFRSSDGLYALVKQQYPDVVLKGRDLFDASLFRDPTSTSVFYTFISQLKRSIDVASPSPTHRFLKTLEAKRKLLRSYTQNIDGLEEKAGLLGSSSKEARTDGKGKGRIKAKEVRSVQLHGDIHRVRCTFCSAEFCCEKEHLDLFNTGVAPDCPECVARSEARVARSARALKTGILRPAIVLYDEPHPLGDDIGTIQSADITRKPEMLIIMGTSLKVHGLKKLVKDFAKAVHDPTSSLSSTSSSPKNGKSLAGKVIFVNKTAPGSEWDGIIDYHVAGETDDWVEKVIDEWKKMRPADWEVQKKLVAVGEPETAGTFKVAKDITNTIGAEQKGAKRKPSLRRENAPPTSDTTAISPASSSPGKRRRTDGHYDDQCNSSKKRIGGEREGRVVFEERGLLFGNTTNIRHDGDRADFNLGELPAVKPRGAATRKRKARVEVEVVIDRRPNSRKVSTTEVVL